MCIYFFQFPLVCKKIICSLGIWNECNRKLFKGVEPSEIKLKHILLKFLFSWLRDCHWEGRFSFLGFIDRLRFRVVVVALFSVVFHLFFNKDLDWYLCSAHTHTIYIYKHKVCKSLLHGFSVDHLVR